MSEYTEPLSRRDVEGAERNTIKHYKKVAALLKTIFDKLREQGIKIENKKVTILDNDKLVYESTGDKKPKLNTITPEVVDRLETGITNPKALEGSLAISIGSKKVYEVEGGKILVDTLGLAPRQEVKPRTEIQIDKNLEGKGRQWLGGAKKVLQSLWQPQQDGEMTFENDEYKFLVKGSYFSVSAKDGRGEVVNNNGLTKAATIDEFTLLQNMDWQSKQYNDVEYQPQQQQQMERGYQC